MSSDGHVDLHCHVLPGLDDGVRDTEEAVALARGLCALGFSTLVATPHVKTAIWENRRETIAPVLASLAESLGGDPPAIEMAGEHWCDDVFWDLLVAGRAIRYSGDRSLLLEWDPRQVPMHIESRFFEMRARHRCRPVIAHPERYEIAWATSLDEIERLQMAGAILLVDLTSLAGQHGRKARRAAERLLDEDRAYALCSDAHRARDLEAVEAGIRQARRIVGEEGLELLLGERTRRVRDGRFDDV